MDLPKKQLGPASNSTTPKYLFVFIFYFRKGSIIAEFKLTFKAEVTAEEALAPLKKETADGKLGSLKVDPGSLKETDAKSSMLLHVFFYVFCDIGGNVGELT